MKKQPEVTAATRQGIIDAFWILFKDKRIDKISINEITKLSGNNRSTFYNYFTDVYDLLSQVEEEMAQKVASEIEKNIAEYASRTPALPPAKFLYEIIAPIFLENEEKLFALVGPNGDPQFTAHLRDRLLQNMVKFSIIPEETPYKDYIITYIYSSMINLLAYWHQQGRNIPEEDFLNLAGQLTMTGVSGYISLQSLTMTE